MQTVIFSLAKTGSCVLPKDALRHASGQGLSRQCCDLWKICCQNRDNMSCRIIDVAAVVSRNWKLLLSVKSRLASRAVASYLAYSRWSLCTGADSICYGRETSRQCYYFPFQLIFIHTGFKDIWFPLFVVKSEQRWQPPSACQFWINPIIDVQAFQHQQPDLMRLNGLMSFVALLQHFPNNTPGGLIYVSCLLHVLEAVTRVLVF